MRPTLRQSLFGGTLIATIATLGSLYYSLGMGLYPCELCWYQRILMYPLVVILGVAAYHNRAEVVWTAAPFVAIGWLIAAYHSYVQRFPGDGLSACAGVSCEAIMYELFGVFSIPNQALIAFTLLGGILAYVWHAELR